MTARARVVTAVVFGVAAAVLVGAAMLWWLSRVYVVTLEVRGPGWVVIEYQNPKCPRLPRRFFGRAVTVPPSGYACFADDPMVGPVVMRVRDPEGRRIRADRIWRRGLVTSTLGSCRIAADVFFFGSAEQLDASTQDVGSVLRARHPECQ